MQLMLFFRPHCLAQAHLSAPRPKFYLLHGGDGQNYLLRVQTYLIRIQGPVAKALKERAHPAVHKPIQRPVLQKPALEQPMQVPIVQQLIEAPKELSAAAQKADQFVKNLQATGHATGLTADEARKIALFIETELPTHVAQKDYYLKKGRTGLARTIEYDPATKQVFIHLKGHNVPIIGEGGFKKATKSILYSPTTPEVVVNATADISEAHEAAIAKQLMGVQHVAKVYAVTTHRKYNGKKRLNIMMKYYKPGSLDKVMNGAAGKLHLKDKMQIAISALKGLEALHNKGIFHRDIKPGNILVDAKNDSQGNRVFEAVLADFGLAYDQKVDRSPLLQAHGTPLFVPPNALAAPDKIQRKDFNQLDIYPLGATFYELLHEQSPTWFRDSIFYKVQKIREMYGPIYAEKALQQEIMKEVGPRLAALSNKASLTPEEEFEKIILNMIAPSAMGTAAKTAAVYRKQLESLYARVA